MRRTDGVKVVRRVTCLNFAVVEQGIQVTDIEGKDTLYPYIRPVMIMGGMTSNPQPDEEKTEIELDQEFGDNPPSFRLAV